MKTKTFRVQNFTIEYYENDELGISMAKNNSEYKSHLTKFLKMYERKFEMTNIIDVGANIGYLTLLLAKEVVKKNGHVFAFEPQGQNYELLVQNINRNNLDNIVAFPNACLNQSGFVFIEDVNNEKDTKNVNMGGFILNDTKEESKKINSVILDNIFYDEKENNLRKIDVVKISANGTEMYVLLGMKNICNNFKPLIIVDLNDKYLRKLGYNSTYVSDVLKKMNYKIFYLENDVFQTEHICVHNDNVNEFESYFNKYIGDHQTLNFINYNALFVKEKVVIPVSKTVLFFVRHFTMRGSEIAIFDYAKHNEDILCNKSIIVCFTEKSQVKHTYNNDRSSFQKFADRFTVLQIDSIDEISQIIDFYKADFFYTLVSGETEERMYKFSERKLWKSCKTIKHCMYESRFPEGDYTIGVSESLNSKFHTKIPIIPHIIDLPNDNGANLRHELGIPSDAIVFGRYGSYDNFNIEYVKETIINCVSSKENVYFLFMNTEQFSFHPRIKFLPHCKTDENKVKFINTCDAMIHGKKDGETFPLALCEFSFLNKPVITTSGKYNGHIFILKGKGLIYRTSEELKEYLTNFEKYKQLNDHWNCVENFSPLKVMDMFENEIFGK